MKKKSAWIRPPSLEDWLRSELLLLLIALLNHCAIPARNKLYRYTKPF